MAAANLPVVHVIREALECVLAPEVAAAVFFESLNGPDGVPETKDEVGLMVRGPLYASLVERVGPDEANAVVQRILLTLEPMQSAGAPRKSREDDATRAVPTHNHPVKVRVVASGAGFATRLRYVLGPTRIEVEATVDPSALVGEAQAAAMVIVDATDFPPQDPQAIVRALDALPATTTRVLWASELPFGQRCREAFFDASKDVVALSRAEGIEPLLDLIRSRRED
jgi:hypothetical protein